jgi:hypothetical protein
LIIVGVCWVGRRGHILRRGTTKRLLGGSSLNDLLSFENFFDADSLELGFPLGFLALNGLVLSEMFDVLGMSVRVI